MTPVDHAVVGGISGTIEVMLLQPTIALKNAIQEGRPLPATPAQLYRGVGVRTVWQAVCASQSLQCGAGACLLCTQAALRGCHNATTDHQ